MKYFTISELCRSDTASRMGINNTPTEEVKKKLERLINEVLDPIREAYGKPIRVSSGYRCRRLNTAVGGAKTSQHLYGEAADLIPADGDTRRLFFLIKKMIDEGKITCGQLIWEYGTRYAPKWVHISLETPKHRNQVLYIGMK